MTLYGVDFTSAPTRRKPLTLARGRVDGDRLVVEETRSLPDWATFEAFLRTPGPWLGGFDLPLGLPLPLQDHFGMDGPALAAHALAMDMADWVDALRAYRGPNGEKELFRPTDRAARSQSPMKCFYIPVGRMYARGAGRLRAAGVSIGERTERTAIEAYPALVADAMGVSRSYKTDDLAKATPVHRDRRAAIVAGLSRPNPYGLLLEGLPDDLVDESGADRLDAILALLQAAWASRREDLGIARGTHPFEGAISDPALIAPGTV